MEDEELETPEQDRRSFMKRMAAVGIAAPIVTTFGTMGLQSSFAQAASTSGHPQRPTTTAPHPPTTEAGTTTTSTLPPTTTTTTSTSTLPPTTTTTTTLRVVEPT